jgi:hypothetical protein
LFDSGESYQNIVRPSLKLTTPQSAKVKVMRAVGVSQDSRVNTVGARDEAWLGLELAIRSIGDGDTNSEDTFMVLGREDQVELSVFLCGVGRPQLLCRPWHIREIQNLDVISLKRLGSLGRMERTF